MKGNILRCLFLLCLAPVQLTASDAIVRKHLTTVEYVSPGKVTLNVYAEVTVFNERGRGFSDFVVMYDPDKPRQAGKEDRCAPDGQQRKNCQNLQGQGC